MFEAGKFNSRGQMPPKDRQFGAAGGPGQSGVAAFLKCAFNSVPVIESTEATFSLPLLDADIQQSLGSKVTIFNDQTVPGAVSVDSTFVQKGELQCDMLCYGVGVHIFAEPMTFMAIGNAYADTATGPIASFDVFTTKDESNNAMGQTTVGLAADGVQPAIIHWGYDAWHAAWEMAQAYLFNWRFYQKIYLMSEQLADVSYFGPYAEAVAAGDSDVQEYAAQVNARYRALSAGFIFQPVNFRRLGSTGGATTGNTALVTPTRDFDLASVTHGGLRNMGAVGCCQPFRRFNKPILLRRGIPIGIELQSNDSYHQAQMTRYLSISNNGNGSPALIPFDAIVDTGRTPVASGVALESTTESDGTPTFSPQSVKTKRMTFKGGVFKVSFLIKGFELTEDWADFIAKNGGQDVYNPAKSSSASGPGMAPVGG